MSRLKKGGAIAALAVGLVGGFEGLRLQTYRDVVGVPTYCYGETRDARMGQTYTKPQCDALFLKRLDEFADGMERCARQPMGEGQYAANLSLAYNIGLGAYCRSSVVRKWNEGDRRASCNAFLLFDKAGGRVVAGLVRRRKEERDLCLKGV